MTDKEKQIVEELANDIYSLKSCDTSFEENCKLLAYDLFTLGWIKPDKDSVVLSKEELQKLSELKKETLELKSKETAEKFAKAIIDKFNCGKLSIEDDEDIEIHLTASELFELAKTIRC